MARGDPRFGDDQAAGGILVEAVDEARLLPVPVHQGVQHAIDMAQRARPTLHREASRLVEHQHIGVFIERDRGKIVAGGAVNARCRRAGRRPVIRRTGLQRRDAHLLAGLHMILGIDAFGVDAQFALADNPLDMAEGQLRKARGQEAVDPHIRLVIGDDQRLHTAGQNLRRCHLHLGPCRTCRHRSRGCRLVAQGRGAAARRRGRRPLGPCIRIALGRLFAACHARLCFNTGTARSGLVRPGLGPALPRRAFRSPAHASPLTIANPSASAAIEMTTEPVT